MPTAPFLAPERDDDFRRGRGKGGGVTYYTRPGSTQVQAVLAHTPTQGRDYYEPFFVETPIVIDRLAFEVTTLQAGSNARVGIYRADTDWQPIGGPLADSGSISTASTGVKTYDPATAIFLSRGRYLGVLNFDTASVAFRAYAFSVPGAPMLDTLGTSTHIDLLSVGRAYAAFPTPGTAWDTVTASSTGLKCVVVFRISKP